MSLAGTRFSSKHTAEEALRLARPPIETSFYFLPEAELPEEESWPGLVLF